MLKARAMVGLEQGAEMSFSQLTFDFSDTEKIELKDKDGDIIPFNRYSDKTKAICRFLKCNQETTRKVQKELEKDYQIFTCGDWQIVLADNEQIIYNFEIGGESVYLGHKYNELNEFAFRKLVEGIKQKEKKPPKAKTVIVTATERQLRKAKQLWYAKEIGFNITSKDYMKWHLL